MVKPTIVIQARLTGSRFPNKVLASLWGVPLIQHVINRVAHTGYHIIVVIPDTKSNDPLADYLEKNHIQYCRGLEHDVLDRFYKCAKFFNLKDIIRVCADTPLINIQTF